MGNIWLEVMYFQDLANNTSPGIEPVTLLLLELYTNHVISSYTVGWYDNVDFFLKYKFKTVFIWKLY